ncbi:hypothetical protein BDV95DRAFT_268655 [Massariosphaeria phaeospora]|uniref:Rhodopsin domain-containing protein n=1 Tax=Massariosphaeria phaeospora TaxID=100035 RepID=A0A7C8MB03_9PLEO|nr:hypothetical protein BDV95DRAFT_268655 [Massariosphaeria phaeospora]
MEPAATLIMARSVASPFSADLIAMSTVSLLFTTAAVCARMFTRVFDRRHIRLDDCTFILPTIDSRLTHSSCDSTLIRMYLLTSYRKQTLTPQAGLVSFIGLLFPAARAGQGAHLGDLSAEASERVYLLTNATAIIYAPVMLFAKLSILIQIRRILSNPKRKWIIWILIAVNVISYSVTFFVRIFACTPRAKISDQSVTVQCVSQRAALIAMGTINIVSDVAMLLLPVYVVSLLQLPQKKLILVAVTFFVGSFSCIASMLRLYYSVRVETSSDFTMAVPQLNTWCLVESTCVLVVACAPTFPRLLQYIQGETQARHPYLKHPHWPSAPSSRSGTPQFGSRSQLSLSPAMQNAFPKDKLTKEAGPAPRGFPTIASRPRPGTPQYRTRSHNVSSAPQFPLNKKRSLPGTSLRLFSTVTDSPCPSTVAHGSRSPINLPSISHIELHKQETIRDTPSSPHLARLSAQSPFQPFRSPIPSIASMPNRPTSRASTIHSAYSQASGSVALSSPGTSMVEFPTPTLENATPMHITHEYGHVHVTNITRTVDVRLSNHTNLGSPVTFCRPESAW